MNRLHCAGLCGLLWAGAWLALPASAQDSWTLFAGGTSLHPVDQRQALGFDTGLAAGIDWQRRTGDFALGLALSQENDGDGLRLDRSFGEWRTRDFTLGAGAVDRHWSPSRHHSLILSRNARPFPSVYLRKEGFSDFETPLLSWLGPWSGEVFLGRLDSEGNPTGTRLLGMRLQIRPVEGLELDFVRVAQFGGAGRSSSLSDVLWGNTNEGDGADANQLAGLGLSYRLPESIAPIRVYAQAIGEDEAGGLPSCFMYLAGIEGSGQVLDVPSTVTLEGATTEISTTENGNCGPGTAYANEFYPGGYTNEGDVMGLPLDTDSRMIQVSGEHELPRFELHWSLAWHDINVTGRDDHRLTSQPVEGAAARLGVATTWDELTLRGDVLYQSYDLDRSDVQRGLGAAVQLSRSF